MKQYGTFLYTDSNNYRGISLIKVHHLSRYITYQGISLIKVYHLSRYITYQRYITPTLYACNWMHHISIKPNCTSTVAFHLSALIGRASHPDTQKIRITGFFFENRLHWRSGIQLLLFIVCTFGLCPIWSSRSHNTVLQTIHRTSKIKYFCITLDKFSRRAKPIRISNVRISGVVLYRRLLVIVIVDLDVIIFSHQRKKIRIQYSSTSAACVPQASRRIG